MEDTRIAVLSIIVEDSESTAKLNEMIHDYAEYVVAVSYTHLNINVASWFMMNKEQKKEQDILFKEEDDWITYIKENEYDIIIADPLLKKAVPFYKGEWYDLPHFAISGKKRQSV